MTFISLFGIYVSNLSILGFIRARDNREHRLVFLLVKEFKQVLFKQIDGLRIEDPIIRFLHGERISDFILEIIHVCLGIFLGLYRVQN